MLLLIQTNGSFGTFGSLPNYPIPGSAPPPLSSVSNQVLFNQLFPAQLTASMVNVGLTFCGSKRRIARTRRAFRTATLTWVS